MTTRVLIVERPGPFRDELLQEMSQRGVEAHVRDDAMEALASLERLTPHVVLVSDNPGPPGALGLCRVLQRKLSHALVYRMGDPSLGDQLEERSVLLPRSAGASAVAGAIFDKDKANDNAHAIAPRAYEGSVGSLELGPLLVAIESRWLTGRLTLTRPGTEREIVFVRGQPVYARSSVLGDRLGAIAVRRNVLTEQQVEHAVDVARARGVRLGVAMLDLSMLDAVALMRLLATQLLEQLTAACNGGATNARFVSDRGVISRYPLQRMASMTALLHAAAQMTDADLATVLDELSEQALETQAQGSVERFLSDLHLSEAVPLSGTTIDSVRTLRARLRAALPAKSTDRLEHPDVIALSLLRSGAFRMHQLQNPTHADVPAGVRSLTPPSLVNAAVRCAHSDLSHWPLSEIARARTPLEQAVDVSLHGKRPPELARALALHGPEVDCDERFRDVYELLLRDPDLLTADAWSSAPVSEVRLRCHAQLKQVDALEADNLGGLCRAQLLQTRERIERVLALLPAPDSSASRAPPPPPALPCAAGRCRSVACVAQAELVDPRHGQHAADELACAAISCSRLSARARQCWRGGAGPAQDPRAACGRWTDAHGPGGCDGGAAHTCADRPRAGPVRRCGAVARAEPLARSASALGRGQHERREAAAGARAPVCSRAQRRTAAVQAFQARPVRGPGGCGRVTRDLSGPETVWPAGAKRRFRDDREAAPAQAPAGLETETASQRLRDACGQCPVVGSPGGLPATSLGDR
jgi:hypothetical protein